MRWDDGIDGATRRIAAINHSPLRIRAGPGTGKTFALMRRVARLLQTGAKPNRIFVSTFTRTAADDLQKELHKLEIPGTNKICTGTLHSFCFKLLYETEVLKFTGREPRPLLKFEERFLLEDIQDSKFGKVRECKKRLRAFNADWARLQNEQPGWPSKRIDRMFHTKLLSWLKFHKAILIGELVPETRRYLSENPHSPYRKAYDHVLVDEYQDLNRAEQALIDLLAENGTLTIIGDENQSIYTFKHANPEGVAKFHETHPGTHDEELTECRRCPSIIVELANNLIGNNVSRAPYRLQPFPNNPEGEVHIVQWQSMEEEAEGIAKFIHNQVNIGNVNPGRVLVLAPRRQFGYLVRDALKRIGAAAHSFFQEEELEGNPKKLEESNAQPSFTLLNLIVKPEDRIALRCWCGFGSNSLSRNAWLRILEYCKESNNSPRTILKSLSSGKLKIPHTLNLVSRYNELEQRLVTLQNLRGMKLVDVLFPRTEEWALPFRKMACSIEEEEFEAPKLLDTLRSAITQPELPTDVNYVRVMSLHKSKGLTADLVIVVGCIQGLIPRIDDDIPESEQTEPLEEQRRLFYVAITRTRQTLLLSSVTHLPRDTAFQMHARIPGGKYTSTFASQFIRELGPLKPKAVKGEQLIPMIST